MSPAAQHVDVAELRHRHPLDDPEALCKVLGLAGRRQPRGVLVCCPSPAHDDQHPSCSVIVGADDTVQCRCHACGWSGDALGLVAAVHQLDVRRDFAEVLRLAAELTGGAVAEQSHRGVGAAPPRRHAAPEPSCGAVAFNALCRPLATLGRLDDKPIAADVWRYLDGRGLLAEARAAGWFALPEAWVQEQWRSLLYELADSDDEAEVDPEHRVRWTRDDLDACGLFGVRGFVHQRHRLAIPWRDRAGRVTTLQRRLLDDGKPRYVFPRGRAPTWPYGVERLRDAVPIAIVEGAVDTIALRCQYRERGMDRDVMGLPGATTWRPEWGNVIEGREVFLALDDDLSGNRAAEALASKLWRGGAMRVHRARPVGAGDWADRD